MVVVVVVVVGEGGGGSHVTGSLALKANALFFFLRNFSLMHYLFI